MSAAPPKTSRYRKLRGKSVSDSRRATVHVFNDQTEGSPSPLRSLTSPGWRRQSKILGHGDTAVAPEVDPHYPVPPIPKPPSPKDYSVTTRPRAAVMPPGPVFGEPVTPTTLRTRHSTQALTSVGCPPPGSTASTGDVPPDVVQHRTTEPAEKSAPGGEVGPEDPPVGEENPALLADRLEAETDKILAEQKRLDLARLHQQLIATESRVSVASSSTLRTPSKSPVFEKFGFFHRGRRSQVTISPSSSTTTFVDLTSRGQSAEPSSSPITPWESKMHMTPPTSPLSPPYGLDKYVTVRYRSEYIRVRIMADTDTVDVLRQASEQMRLPVAPAASNLHECCSPHGIERRLRRYERIQEVLASWPQNSRNSLVIRHACGPYNDKDLDISFVPLSKTPSTVTAQLHHCSRPGKWNKRWVTLLCDGQVLSSKKADFSPAEKDCQVLCDLSCYDIYTPTDEPAILLDEGRSSRSPRASPVKSLKPPKRWVFAVRSQERPTTSLEKTNYVHFFCTDDPAVANGFQASVHAWRSWYIVKTRGDAQRKRDSDVEMTSPTWITPREEKSMSSTIPMGVASNPVLKVSIGEFQPLMNLEHEIDEFRKNWVPELPLALPPTTPGTGSDASMMTPSTSGGMGPGKASLDLSSPSEQRRKRRDLKRSLTSIEIREQEHAHDALTEDSAGATIIITEPQAPKTPIRSDLAHSLTPAKPEPTPWLPSAAEHTAKLRAEQIRLERLSTPPVTPQRPATSTGVVRGRNSVYVCLPPNMDRRPVPQSQPPVPHATSYLDWAEPLPPLPMGIPAGQNPGPASGKYSLNPSRGASRHLEVPTTSGKRRNLMSMPSMPALVKSGSPKKQRGAPGLPAPWREGDSHPDDRSSGTSSGRPSTSSGGRPSTSSGGSAGDMGSGVGTRQLSKGRSGSLTSLRRGARAPPLVDAPPPIPPLPLHVRPAIREGTGVRPLGMVVADDARRRASGNR